MTRRALFTETERVVIVLENTGPNGPDIDKPDDIIKPLLTKFAGYVSQLQENEGNEFPVGPDLQKISLRDSSGNPAPLTPLNQGYLSKDSLQESKTIYEKTSNSGQLDIDGSNFQIKKGKLTSESPSSQDLLDGINTLNSESEFSKRIDIVLSDNNQFTTDNPVIDTNKTFDENSWTYPVQNDFGIHSPRKYPDGRTAQALKVKDLKKVGLLSLLNASGELAIPKDPNTTELLTTAAPGIARMGGKIPTSRFNAVNIYKDIDPTIQKKTPTDFVDNGGNLSYGSPYNYAAPFTGFGAVASATAATLLALTVGTMVRALANLVKPNQIQENTQINDSRARKRFLGNYLGLTKDDNSLRINDLTLDLLHTRHDYVACVNRGTNVFFGLDKDGNFNVRLTSATNRIVNEHGFYSVILRNITRSISDVVFPLGNGNTLNNTLAQVDPTSLMGFIKNFNNSPLLKFMNTLAGIGDITLSIGDDDESFIDIDDISELDPTGAGINPAIIHAKNRFDNGKMAWRQNSTPSLYLIPPDLLSSARRFNRNKEEDIHKVYATIGSAVERVGDSRDSNIVAAQSKLDNNNRIKQEIVEQMENHLERDYMPFYFQDLRTNEIISCHAFLEEVSDSYSVDYNQSEGFGRVGKVSTYKNTNRNISLSFKLLAMDPEDFDMMWYKVNKLITMVYPQWSAGREIKWGGNRFTQPFSQQISASPLIRLRLGDLFKTNYSKFAVARLFGISDDPAKFSLERSETGPNNSQTFESQRRIIETIRTIRTRMMDQAQGFQEGDIAILRENAVHGARTANPRYIRMGNNAAPSTGNLPTRSRNPLRRQSTPNDDLVLHYNTRVRIERSRAPDEARNYRRYLVSVLNPSDGQQGQFIVEQNHLQVDSDYVQRQARTQVLGDSSNNNNPQTTETAVNEFLSDERNPIFQSFNSTKGRGLACFIKSLNFDYGDVMWNTTSINGRAPMFMKISMEFEPVHDIHPGIDSNGFNTAPLYNVGNAMKYLGKEEDYPYLDSEFAKAREELTRTRR